MTSPFQSQLFRVLGFFSLLSCSYGQDAFVSLPGTSPAKSQGGLSYLGDIIPNEIPFFEKWNSTASCEERICLEEEGLVSEVPT